MLSVNIGGGMRVTDRAAVARRPALRALVDDESLCVQACAKLATAAASVRERGAKLAVFCETHLRAGDEAKRVERWLQAAEHGNGEWRAHAAHATAAGGNGSTGVVVWLHEPTFEVLGTPEVLLVGRLLRLRLRLREDDTELVLFAAYMPPRCAIEGLVTAQEREELEVAWEALHVAVAAAQAEGEQVLIAGDLNAEAWQARQR
jgi:hypothetical protein